MKPFVPNYELTVEEIKRRIKLSEGNLSDQMKKEHKLNGEYNALQVNRKATRKRVLKIQGYLLDMNNLLKTHPKNNP